MRETESEPAAPLPGIRAGDNHGEIHRSMPSESLQPEGVLRILR